MDTKILEIPLEHISETLNTEPQILYETETDKCLAYLKDFDYYFVFSIINPNNNLINKHIKLPGDFVEKHNSNYRNLLNEFLKITGNKFRSHNDEFIIELEGKSKQLHMNPYDFNGAMPFGVESGDKISFFFVINALKYKTFLEDYQVRS